MLEDAFQLGYIGIGIAGLELDLYSNSVSGDCYKYIRISLLLSETEKKHCSQMVKDDLQQLKATVFAGMGFWHPSLLLGVFGNESDW